MVWGRRDLDPLLVVQVLRSEGFEAQPEHVFFAQQDNVALSDLAASCRVAWKTAEAVAKLLSAV